MSNVIKSIFSESKAALAGACAMSDTLARGFSRLHMYDT